MRLSSHQPQRDDDGTAAHSMHDWLPGLMQRSGPGFGDGEGEGDGPVDDEFDDGSTDENDDEEVDDEKGGDDSDDDEEERRRVEASTVADASMTPRRTSMTEMIDAILHRCCIIMID